MGRLRWTIYWSEKSTKPQSTFGCLFGQQIGCGKERWLYLCRQIIEGIFDAWGGIRHGQLATRQPISMGLPACTPPQSTSAWLVGGGIAQGTEKQLRFVVCIFQNICRWFFFKASLHCVQAGKFDRLAQLPVSNIYQSTSVHWVVGLDGRSKLQRLRY